MSAEHVAAFPVNGVNTRWHPPDGAATEQFDALVAEAAERGASGARLDALERARRLGMAVSAQLDRHHRREAGFSGLVDTARDLLTPYDPDTLLKVIARRARLLLGVDACYVA